MDYLTIKEGDLFLLTDRRGDVPGDYFGLFCSDTQFLDRWRLLLAGQALKPLSAWAAEGWRSTVMLVNGPESSLPGLFPLELEVLRRQVVWNGGLYEEIRLMNRSLRTARVPVAISFGSSFADLFEYRGFTRESRGTDLLPERQENGVVLRYQGRDGLFRRTVIRWSIAPHHLTFRPGEGSQGTARWEFDLEPGATRVLTAAIAPVMGDGPLPEIGDVHLANEEMVNAYARWQQGVTRLECDHPDVDRALKRAVQDLRTLRLDFGHGPFPAAGIPWFVTLFGRDALITAYQALLLDPGQARGALRTLAAYQGQDEAPLRSEQPGKILHEMRQGEMGRLGEHPFSRSYGSVDATALFLVLLAEYLRWTGDEAFVREMLPAARRALTWLGLYGDPDGDHLIEYERATGPGLKVQSWKDSDASMFRPDGTPPEPPVAVVEVQGYAFDAYRSMASLLERLGAGEPGEVERLRSQAEALRQAFETHFWIEERSCYANALDRQNDPIPTLTSGAGQALWSGIVAPDRAQKVADTLLDAPLFSGWGIRTMATSEPIYSPLLYHNGTVWPHDNSLIAMGLSRYGLHQHVRRVGGSLFQAARFFEEHRLPEAFCGYAAEDGPPVKFPTACSPQAWAAAAPFLLLRALMGLEPDVGAGVIRLSPCLPDWMGQVRLDGLRIGQGELDLTVRRSEVDVRRNTTGLKVFVEKGAL